MVRMFMRSDDVYAFLFFFYNDTATTEIYTLSLHDALPIYLRRTAASSMAAMGIPRFIVGRVLNHAERSEEHTSELQSQSNLVCRLLLEKKKRYMKTRTQKPAQ